MKHRGQTSATGSPVLNGSIVEPTSSMVETALLRAAVALAEELHFGRAARALQTSQSALSQRIARLEDILGFPLFERDRRKVRLLPAGNAFVAEARIALKQITSAAEVARDAAEGRTGEVVIGAGYLALIRYAPSALRRLVEAMPGISVRIETGSTADLQAALSEGRVDIAYLHPPLANPARFEGHSLPSEQLLLVVQETDPLISVAKNDGPIPWELLRDRPLVMYPRSQGAHLHDTIIARCVAAGFSPRLASSTAPQVSMPGLVAAGLGAALVAAPLAALQHPGVAYLEMAEPVKLDIGLFTRRGEQHTVVKRTVAKLIEL